MSSPAESITLQQQQQKQQQQQVSAAFRTPPFPFHALSPCACPLFPAFLANHLSGSSRRAQDARQV